MEVKVVKMKAKLNIFSFFISLFLFISPALALPCAFYGEVKLDGSPINGTNVEAYLTNGTFMSKGKEPSAGFGHYSIAVNAPGENVTLKIKGIVIDQGVKLCGNGNLYSLNISATSPPTTIPMTTVQYSGGGGGGGGHQTTTTINTTKKTNTTTIATTIPSNDNSNVETTIPVTTESSNTVQNTFDITGLFLNGIASLGYWSILIVIIIIWAIAALIWRMHSNKEESKETSEEDENPKEDMTSEKKSEETSKEESE
jgi:hypothetical protein